MNINFTGIKNPGYYTINIYPAIQHDNSIAQYSEENYINAKYINMELTDDFNGKDLSEYKKKLKGFDTDYLEHPINPNSINIGILKGELATDKDTYLFLNGKLVELEDKNLPMISFIAKKLNKLKNDIGSVETDKNFYKTDIAANTLMLGKDLRDDYASYEDPMPDLKRYYNSKYIAETSAKMFKLLNNKMMEYLDIPPEKRKQ